MPFAVFALACTVARPIIALDAAERKAPTEFRIWSFGKVDTTKGTFLFDSKSAYSVMKAWQDWGNRLTFDYGHDATLGAKGEDGKSAGSCNLELRKDGLYAVDVRWTDKAATGLVDREWLYFSPTFLTDKAGRIKSLINIALTNVPATKNMAPLVAASRETSMDPIEEAKKKRDAAKASFKDALFDMVTLSADDDGGDTEEMKAAKATKMAQAKAKLAKCKLELDAAMRECAALGDDGSDDAGGDDPSGDDANAPPKPKDKPDPTATSRTAAGRRPAGRVVAASRTAGGTARIAELVFEITGASSEAEALGKLAALSEVAQGGETSGGVLERFEQLESRLFKSEAAALMKKATEEGRLTPKQRAYACKITDLVELQGYLDTLPVVAATRTNGRTAEPDVKNSSQFTADTLEDWEIEMCDRMGTSQADYLAQKKNNAERRATSQNARPLQLVSKRA